jgi:hypothetical protein
MTIQILFKLRSRIILYIKDFVYLQHAENIFKNWNKKENWLLRHRRLVLSICDLKVSNETALDLHVYTYSRVLQDLNLKTKNSLFIYSCNSTLTIIRRNNLSPWSFCFDCFSFLFGYRVSTIPGTSLNRVCYF